MHNDPRLRAARLPALLFALLAPSAGLAGQERKADPELVFELHVAKPPGLARLRDAAVRACAPLAKLVPEGQPSLGEWLPLTVRAYADLTGAKEMVGARFYVEVDVACKPDTTFIAKGGLRAVPGEADTWRDGVGAVRVQPRPGGGARFTIAWGLGAALEDVPVISGRPARQLRGADQRILDGARRGFAYAFGRIGPFAQLEPDVRRVLGLVGRDGLTFAAAVREVDGRPELSVESGIRAGAGIIGAFLPHLDRDAQPFGDFAGEPAIIQAFDLGDGIGKSLLTLVELATVGRQIPPATMRAIRGALGAFTGRLSAYIDLRGAALQGAAIHLEFAEGAVKDVRGAVAALLAAAQIPVDAADDSFRGTLPDGKPFEIVLSATTLAMHLGGRPKGDPAQGGVQVPRIPAQFDTVAPFKAWFGPELSRAYRELRRPEQDSESEAYKAGVRMVSILAPELFQNGALLTLHLDRTSTRIVVRFR